MSTERVAEQPNNGAGAGTAAATPSVGLAGLADGPLEILDGWVYFNVMRKFDLAPTRVRLPLNFILGIAGQALVAMGATAGMSSAPRKG